MGECESVRVRPYTADITRHLTISAPAVLAERRVTTNLVAEIHFPDPVLEIKDIKKRVQIVQCSLMLPALAPDQYPPEDDFLVPLFLKGFVRKNIQYATPCHHPSGKCVASDLRSLTVNIPFHCTTTIPLGEFIIEPEFPRVSPRTEFDFFRAQDLGHGFPEKDQLLSSDLSQFHQVSSQFYNHLPFCELVSHNITEWDEAIDRKKHEHDTFEGTFYTVVEKMSLQFTIRVLQNQQIPIGKLLPCDND
ncbi:DUF3794 domain-containing protein [Bacillus sp. T33-2]|nr:DUF3794 domain-containing protein [Bacillus sp. T33-2]